MTRRAGNRLRAEIDEGMTDYIDQRAKRGRIRRCGFDTRTTSSKWWNAMLRDITIPKGAFLLFRLMKGAPKRFSVLH